MIPFFFTRYRKAPLATCVSFISSMCYLGAVFFSVGYFLNWSGLKDDTSVGEALLAAAICAVLGVALMKLAQWLATRKQRKLAEREAASRPAPTPPPRPATASGPAAATGARATSAAYCPKCGGRIEPGDAFCVNCGAKL